MKLALYKLRNTIRDTVSNIKNLPASLLWTLKMIPAGLRGELAAMYCTLNMVHIKANGEQVDYGTVCRKKVTQVFVVDIVRAMDSTGTYAAQYGTFNDYIYHDSGVGVTSTPLGLNTDTAIETTDAVSRATGVSTATGTTTGILTSIATITYASTLAITEHGIFNASTGGTLLDRNLFTAVNVVSGDSIQFTYVLTISPEA